MDLFSGMEKEEAASRVDPYRFVRDKGSSAVFSHFPDMETNLLGTVDF
jgi:hypothetical protein